MNAINSVIGGGWTNTIQPSASYSVIGGGQNNTIQTNSSGAAIAGGEQNGVGPNAGNAFVAGGYGNNANGNCAFAAGNFALVTNANSFVWSDGTTTTTSANDHSVTMRASGGYRFLTGSSVVFTTGGSGSDQTVSWTPGNGSWSFTSDRTVKDRFKVVDAVGILDKVAQLPITEWSYQGYGQRHIGAMAQDFHALFPLNDNEKVLNDADLHGVELAAIQGLNEKVENGKQKAESRMERLEAENAALKARLEKLEQFLSAKNGGGQ